MDQIKSTRDKAEELTEDLKSKVALHSQLIGEFEKSKRNISRWVQYKLFTQNGKLLQLDLIPLYCSRQKLEMLIHHVS